MSNEVIHIDIDRPEQDNGVETLGKLFVRQEGVTDPIFTCETLELPWKDNTRRISCIQSGTYVGRKVGPTRIPYPHIEIQNVSGRSGICIHAANFVSQLLGCVAVGDGLADINKDGQLDVINSRKTFEKLMEILPDEFLINIVRK